MQFDILHAAHGARPAAALRRCGSALACFGFTLALTSVIPNFAVAQQTGRPPSIPPQLQTFGAPGYHENPANKPPPRMPTVTRAQPHADTKPLFKLAGISLSGATAISDPAIAETYTRYIGRTVSQADLLSITTAIDDLYRN